jgi:hypothetical protein
LLERYTQHGGGDFVAMARPLSHKCSTVRHHPRTLPVQPLDGTGRHHFFEWQLSDPQQVDASFGGDTGTFVAKLTVGDKR